MPTSFNLEPGPKLTPELDGKKVVFSRSDDDDKRSSAKPASSGSSEASQPQTTDAAEGAARGEKQGKAK